MNKYLVSFCNTGPNIRIAIVSSDGIEREVTIDAAAVGPTRLVGITGLAFLDGQYILALQCNLAALAVLDLDLKLRSIVSLPQLADLHGLAVYKNRLLIASTGTNQICAWSPAESVDEILWQDGAALCDRDHINDFAVIEGSVVACMFGQRLPDRMREGKVIDVAQQRALVTGLREPHSVAFWKGTMHVLESATGDLIECRAGFAPRRLAGILGYPRGLCIDETGFIVGSSGYRDISRGTVGDRRRVPLIKGEAAVHPLSGSAIYFLDHQANLKHIVDTSGVGSEIYQIIPCQS